MKAIAIFLINLRAPYLIMNILVFIKRSYKSLPPLPPKIKLCWLLNLKWFWNFEQTNQFLYLYIYTYIYILIEWLLVSILKVTPNHIPLKYRCPIGGNYWTRHIYQVNYIVEYGFQFAWKTGHFHVYQTTRVNTMHDGCPNFIPQETSNELCSVILAQGGFLCILESRYLQLGNKFEGLLVFHKEG